MTTIEEQIDELLGMAADKQDAECDLAQYENDAAMYGPRTSRGQRARKHLPNVRKRVQWTSERLATARARFLARYAAGAP